jgi:ABC-type tungstate transport system substrate-binding protein
MVRMGEMPMAFALVIILLVLAFAANIVLTLIQQRDNPTWIQKFWR